MNKLYIIVPNPWSTYPAFMACVRKLEDITLKEPGCVAYLVGEAIYDLPPGFVCNVANLTHLRPLGLGPINCDHLFRGEDA